MLENAFEAVRFLVKVAWLVFEPLFWPALAFGLLAVAVKGREALEAARRAAAETRITLSLYVFDLFLIGPPLGIAILLIVRTVDRYGLAVVSDTAWSSIGIPATVLITVFVGDFFSYWRHRLEHTRWLWPAHAIHHSDTEVTWLTGDRFHPVNRLVTAIVDNSILALLGAPAWAITANELIRHYYGEFIHADVPWTYGRAGALFVSPAMHRWHHARDVTGSGSNFATVFSVFDRAFGTLYVPGPCRVALGVTDDMGTGAVGQLTYPFKCWMGDWTAMRSGARILYSLCDRIAVLRARSAPGRHSQPAKGEAPPTMGYQGRALGGLRLPRWVKARRLTRMAPTAPSDAAAPPFVEATD